MKLTNKMLIMIEKDVKAFLLKKTEINFDVFTFRSDTDIILIIATYGNIKAESWYNEHISELPEMIGMATELNWKYVNEVFVLDSGYVVFEEAINDHFFEQYNVIEGGEYHSPVTFEDGKRLNYEWNNEWQEFRFAKKIL